MSKPTPHEMLGLRVRLTGRVPGPEGASGCLDGFQCFREIPILWAVRLDEPTCNGRTVLVEPDGFELLDEPRSFTPVPGYAD